MRLDAADQVRVARALAATDPFALQADDVLAAYRMAGLDDPQPDLVREIVKLAKGVSARPGLREVLLDFRQDAIRNLSRQFGGKPKDEDALRNYLLMYLPTRGYAEAHTGKGKTDVLIPRPDDAVIETKIWTAPQKFEDGMTELGEYIRTERPKQAAMVVFGDRDPLPSIIQDHREAIAEVRELEGLQVPVIVVPFDVEYPSKVGESERRKKRGRQR